MAYWDPGKHKQILMVWLSLGEFLIHAFFAFPANPRTVPSCWRSGSSPRHFSRADQELKVGERSIQSISSAGQESDYFVLPPCFSFCS